MTVVLVADDDADIRDLVAFKLEQAGLEVVAVGDGAACRGAAVRNAIGRPKPPARCRAEGTAASSRIGSVSYAR